MQVNHLKVLMSLLVLAHLLGNLWHGDAHAVLEVDLPGYKWAFVYIVIIIGPIAGAVLLWTHWYVAGYWAVAVCMTGSVLFSVYHHYVMISPDNVEHLPPGSPEAHAHFANSAELIALLALATALLGFYGVGRVARRGT